MGKARQSNFCVEPVTARKVHAGQYEYSAGGYTVDVTRIPGNPAYGDTTDMWVAVARWSANEHSDPLHFKLHATATAHSMLSDRIMRDRNRT